jgi:hypothetical protein
MSTPSASKVKTDIDVLRRSLERARVRVGEVTLAGETHERQVQLVRSHDTPPARLDEATRDLETALRKREAADAELQPSRRCSCERCPGDVWA